MLSLSCHFLGTDASRIIVAPSVKWIIYDFSCFRLLFLGSDELRSVLVSPNIYPLYTDFCKQLLLWVNFGWWFSSQGFSLCDLDEERWHMLQNSLLFCLQQMTVRSCIGMIECVLWQQAVQPVGVRKLKEREKERVLPQTHCTSVFKAVWPFLNLNYDQWFIIVWPEVTHSLYDTFLRFMGFFLRKISHSADTLSGQETLSSSAFFPH